MAHPAFDRVDHRPWPVPARRWSWRQTWLDLSFLHWPIDAAQLRPLVPPGLAVQEHDGSSWIGVVPFRMSGVMRRPLPDLPWISAFPELNVRIYVERDGRPGVWFLSLDATNPLAVWAAKRLFDLPYHRARIRLSPSNGGVEYDSVRSSDRSVAFRAGYAPTSDVRRAEPGTLEHFLTERYCLYAVDSGGVLYRTEVHHAPWPLQSARIDLRNNTMAQPFGHRLDASPALVHFSRRLDVVVWSPERC